MDVKELEILGTEVERHWYYQSKSEAVRRLIEPLHPKTLLDVGAGSGFFARHLLKTSEARRAYCIDTAYESEWTATEAGKDIHYMRSVASHDADVVLFLDVLEHVEDDLALLSEYVSFAPAGTHFLISVPAFQFLWSAHDIFLEHKRRYTLASLSALVERSKLEIVERNYFFALVFPIAAASRFAMRIATKEGMKPASQLKIHSKPVNRLLGAVCGLELAVFRKNQIAGLTAFCLARKP